MRFDEFPLTLRSAQRGGMVSITHDRVQWNSSSEEESAFSVSQHGNRVVRIYTKTGGMEFPGDVPYDLSTRKIINRVFVLLDMPYEMISIGGVIKLKNTFDPSKTRPYIRGMKIGLSARQYRSFLAQAYRFDGELVRAVREGI